MKKITSPELIGKERETLATFESDKSENPDWMDYGDTINDENDGLTTNKLNFSRQQDYVTERAKELSNSAPTGTRLHAHSPSLEEIRLIVRKVAIRVVKSVIGEIEGGTNNYRRRGKSKKSSSDGSILVDSQMKNVSSSIKDDVSSGIAITN